MTSVYFVFFSPDTAVVSLLPDGYEADGFFRDLTEATSFFAGAGGRGEGAAALVNCLDYYRNTPLRQKEPDADLLRQLAELKEAGGGLGIRLLMPENRNADQNLLIELMSRGFYDFWFVTALDGALLADVLSTDRDFREMEAYLGTLPPPDAAVQSEDGQNRFGALFKGNPHLEKTLGKWLDKGIGLLDGNGGKSQKQPKRFEGRRLRPTEESYPPPDEYHSPPEESYPPPEEYHSPTDEFYPEEEAYPDNGDGAISAGPAWVEGSAGEGEAGENSRQTGDDGYFESLLAGESRIPAISVDLGGGGPAPGSASGVWQKGAGLVKALTGARNPERKAGYAGQKMHDAAPANDTILFYSEEDCLLPYALAVMTAERLASVGGKTLLVELPGSGNRLAVTLGLRHPEKHLSGALRFFASGGDGAWKDYCFSGPELYDDPRAIDHAVCSKRLPPSLYFLPEGYGEEAIHAQWDGFQASLIHWAVMEERFSYLIYVGFGCGENLRWKKGLICSHKVIAFPPWPPGFNGASVLEAEWSKGCLPAFDGSWGGKYIRKEAASMNLKNYLVIPGALKEDFVCMASMDRDSGERSPESRESLDALLGCLQAGRAVSRRDE